MRNQIEQWIREFVENYQAKDDVQTKWRVPLVAFADAQDEQFFQLKQLVGPNHALPQDFLAEAQTVVSFFIPFTKEIVESNLDGEMSSRVWAIAYIETNQLIAQLNSFINEQLVSLGYQSTIIPATHNFDKAKLISDWSHRHVAYIAGLGTFGLNNMLITEQGCCGRVGSLVTDLKLTPTPRPAEENCLYKAHGSCKQCVTKCANQALTVDGFDRSKCYENCLENDQYHADLGLTDVCGKCLVQLPCSLTNPVKI